MQFKIQRHEKLADQLYGSILEQIVSGNFPEGSKLPSETEISARFGVSRPVVREALRKLQSGGLVKARKGVGSFVTSRPPQGLIDHADPASVAGLLRCLEARLAIEGASARQAARRADARDIARIDRTLAVLGEGIRGGSVPQDADFAFHIAVAEASGNELFVRLLDTIGEVMRHGIGVALSITRGGSAARAERVLREHTRIADAIRAQDPDAAELMMRYHLVQARQRVTDHAEDG